MPDPNGIEYAGPARQGCAQCGAQWPTWDRKTRAHHLRHCAPTWRAYVGKIRASRIPAHGARVKETTA